MTHSYHFSHLELDRSTSGFGYGLFSGQTAPHYVYLDATNARDPILYSGSIEESELQVIQLCKTNKGCHHVKSTRDVSELSSKHLHLLGSFMYSWIIELLDKTRPSESNLLKWLLCFLETLVSEGLVIQGVINTIKQGLEEPQTDQAPTV